MLDLYTVRVNVLTFLIVRENDNHNTVLISHNVEKKKRLDPFYL